MLLVVWFVLVGGCRSATPGSENERTAPAQSMMPADFALSFGKGGGFTGVWTGYRIEPDGTVQRWRGRAIDENLTPAGALTAAELEAVWQRLQTEDFFAVENQGPGNMTGYIAVRADSATHTVRWPVSLEASARQSPLEQLYAYLLGLAEGAEQD